jgi:Flp pilus assembly pilin Flp
VSSISDFAYALFASWIAVIIATAIPLVDTLVNTGFSEVAYTLK